MTLNASTVGGRCFPGNARANTPFGSGNRPDEGTSGNVGAGGPDSSVNTRSKFDGAFSS